MRASLDGLQARSQHSADSTRPDVAAHEQVSMPRQLYAALTHARQLEPKYM